MQDLNIAFIQSDLVWENRDANLKAFSKKIEKIVSPVDLIILPEMFSSGFTMGCNQCSEEPDGPAQTWMKEIATSKNCVITGSLLIKENNAFYNRLFWVHPDGSYEYYDKRHLFRFGNEHEYFSPGKNKLIAKVKDWKFCPLICYDLRFPVWSKNRYINNTFEYDCLLCVASWPERRSYAWKSLLIARAIENMSYCIGVNRVGTDGKDTTYSGDSMIIDPLGSIAISAAPKQEEVISYTLSAKVLTDWRERFNVGQDWDEFLVL
jgi:omega-amidase